MEKRFSPIIIKYICIFFCMFLSTQISASEEETRICIDNSFAPTFTSEDQALGRLNVVLPLSDGKLLVGGDFDHVDGRNKINIVRFNQDLSIDDTLFEVDFISSTQVKLMVEQADGKILVGGDLRLRSQPGFPGQIDLIRFNADGSLDSSFYFGIDIGRGRPVNVIKVQDDGKILVGGLIQLRNSELKMLVRLNPDGSLDDTFFTDRSTSTLTEVTNIFLQEDGKIIVVGNFSEFNNLEAPGIVRLNPDGSTDLNFELSRGLLSILEDGSFLFNGEFRNGASPLTKLLPDGSLDTEFSTQLNSTVSSVVELQDGRLLIGGRFSRVNGQFFKHLALLDENGKVDPNFDFTIGTFTLSNFLETDQSGKILLGIEGASIGGTRLTRLRTDCRLPSDTHSGMLYLLLLDD